MFVYLFSLPNLWLLIKLLPVFIVLFVFYKFLYRYNEERLYAKLAKATGCSAPVQWRIWDPVMSLDFLYITYKGFVNRTVMEDGRQRFIKSNANTLKAYLMGHFITTMEPQNVKAVLATQFKDFELGEERRIMLGPIIGEGIFILDGPAWKHSRDLLRPNFERAQIDDSEMFERHAQSLIDAIPKDGEPVALKPLFFLASLDIATEFLFDRSTECLDPNRRSEGDDLDVEGFVEAFNQVQQIIDGSSTSNFGFLSLFIGLFLPNPKQKRNVKKLHAFVDTIVSQAITSQEEKKALQSDDADGGEKHRYVFLHELIASTSDPTKIRSELLNILLAGRDSTASLLSNIFFTLSHSPAIFSKLEHEILTSLPADSNPTFADLKGLPYLRALVNESLRLYPIVPENNRTASRDTSIPVGGGPDGTKPVFVKKGTMVQWSTWAMHRRHDLYGDDAEEFKPERWLDGPDGQKGLRVGWEYLPFNGGPRICLGQQFALMEVYYLVVKLVRAFESIEACDKDSTWRESVSIIVAVDSDVKVMLKPRKML